jgi:hypothetical protein
MQVIWSRVLALLLVILATIVLVRSWASIVAFVKTAADIQPYTSPEEQTAGLIAFGLIALFILALVRILTQAPRK